jgi:hypothetical protein
VEVLRESVVSAAGACRVLSYGQRVTVECTLNSCTCTLALENDATSSLTSFVKPDGPQLFHAFGLPQYFQSA